MEQKILTLPDGRVMAYRVAGDPHAKPLLFFHGTPGTSLQAELLAEDAAAKGFYIIAPDRPGLGDSTYQPERFWYDYPADIRVLISELKIEHFALMGISGGGPYAIACAAAMPEYLTKAVLLSPWWYPHGSKNANEGLTSLFKTYAYLTQHSIGMTKPIAKMATYFAQKSPRAVIEHLIGQLNDDDQQLFLNPSLKALMIEDVENAFKNGWEGPWRETTLEFIQPRVIPSRILFHLDIFHGTEDKIVPYHYAQKLVAELPQSELHTVEGGGHFCALRIKDKVFQKLGA